MWKHNSHQISVQNPIGMEVVDAIENLVEERLDHALVHHDLLLAGLGRPVVLDDVPEVVLRVVDEQPDLAVRVGEEHPLEVDHVRVLQFTQELKNFEKGEVRTGKTGAGKF